ncbi:hypothetical protein G5645_01895 [Pectobacterium carotovorum]|uniref:hypothetical protein n=1 Tax=Pectobacterium carotovorum TaxID=554 RepID=UPI00191F16F9|nr:hypothetical protein [Pectobacterium carotovorum]MBL0906738.1 hypothetical protein [Pectobacterium carotovorum]
MDKLLTKARHSLLIVSFLGILFSLTGASFTGKSAIASYLGLKFSDANGFKWVYLIILLYTLFRYVIYYHNDFIGLMSDSMKRSIKRPLIKIPLKKLMVGVFGGEESTRSYKYQDDEKEKDGFFTFYITEHDNYESTFKCRINISNRSLNNYFTIITSKKSNFLTGGGNECGYLKQCLERANVNYNEFPDGVEYIYVVKNISWVFIGVLFSGIISFIYDSLTRIDFFEYTVPLVSAIIAFIMTIEYFFFSEKTLGTLPLILNGFI